MKLRFSIQACILLTCLISNLFVFSWLIYELPSYVLAKFHDYLINLIKIKNASIRSGIRVPLGVCELLEGIRKMSNFIDSFLFGGKRRLKD